MRADALHGRRGWVSRSASSAELARDVRFFTEYEAALEVARTLGGAVVGTRGRLVDFSAGVGLMTPRTGWLQWLAWHLAAGAAGLAATVQVCRYRVQRR